MKISEFKISNGFILFENARKRVLISLLNVAEIRETENGKVEIVTTTHQDTFTLDVSFNVIEIKLGFHSI